MGLFSKEVKIDNTRENRKKCWEKRDVFFKCLDDNDILKPSEGKKVCNKEYSEYEQNCVNSWVKYFNEKRIVDYRKEQMLKQQQERENAQ